MPLNRSQLSNDLIDRLREADRNRQQRCLGSRIFAEAADEIESLRAKFTNLDQPKYKGAPMLDEVLKQPSPEFRAWVESLPSAYWARYDLSAARIGWEAGRASAGNRMEAPTND